MGLIVFSCLILDYEFQAHQVELESLAARLEEENEQLLKEKVIHLIQFSYHVAVIT